MAENLDIYFARWTKRLTDMIDKDAPLIVGNKALSLFKRNFREEGFFGEKWPDVIRRTGKQYRYTSKNGKARTRIVKPQPGAFGRRPILTGQTGDLGRSLEMKTASGEVTVSSNLVYSAIHNDGGRAGRGHRSLIPRRRFMGDHPQLVAELTATLQKWLDKKANEIKN